MSKFKPCLYAFGLSVVALSVSACSAETSSSNMKNNQQANPQTDDIAITESVGLPKQNLSSSKNSPSDDSDEILAEKYAQNGIDIDYENTPVLMELYVLNKAGAAGRQLPKDTAKKLKSYAFGAQVDVIEDNKDWYGIREMIPRAFEDDDGRRIVVDKEEKIYIKKSEVGTIDKVVLVAFLFIESSHDSQF